MWNRSCWPKYEGGLGIKKAKDMNAAMLTKLGSKILIEPHNLWVRIVSDKYLTSANFLEAKKTNTVITMWKHILDYRYLIKKGLC